MVSRVSRLLENVVPGLLHDHGEIEPGIPCIRCAARCNAKYPVNERSPGAFRPVPGPVMAGGVPEICSRIIVSLIHQLKTTPGDRYVPIIGKSRGPPEIYLNNLSLPKFNCPAGFALVYGVPDPWHRVPDRY